MNTNPRARAAGGRPLNAIIGCENGRTGRRKKPGGRNCGCRNCGGCPHGSSRRPGRQGGEITPQAALELTNATGSDTLSAASEIEKLLIYTESKRPVSLEDVQVLCASGDQTNIFEMVEAVTRGDARRGMKLLHQMLEKEDAQVIFGMIVRQFRMLIQAKAILDDRGGVNEVTQALKTADFVARKLVEQARRFSLSDLQEIYRKLLDIDLESKNSTTPWEVALDTLVIDISR